MRTRTIITSLAVLLGLAGPAGATLPSTITDQFRLWLKADVGVKDAGGDDASDGEAVATWQDQSGYGNHVTFGATKPTLDSDGGAAGEAVLAVAAGADGAITYSADLDSNAGFAIFWAAKNTGTANAALLDNRNDASTTTAGYLIRRVNSGDNWSAYIWNAAGTGIDNQPAATTSNAAHVLAVTHDGSNSRLYQDDAQTAADTKAVNGYAQRGSGSMTVFESINDLLPWVGTCAEIIYFTGTPSATQRAAIMQELTNRHLSNPGAVGSAGSIASAQVIGRGSQVKLTFGVPGASAWAAPFFIDSEKLPALTVASQTPAGGTSARTVTVEGILGAEVNASSQLELTLLIDGLLYQGDTITATGVAQLVIDGDGDYSDAYTDQAVTPQKAGDVSAISTAADTLTVTGHGLSSGNWVYLKTTGDLPAATPALAENTAYEVTVVDPDTIKLHDSYALYVAGTAIDLTGEGTGTLSILTGTPYGKPIFRFFHGDDDGTPFLERDVVDGVVTLDCYCLHWSGLSAINVTATDSNSDTETAAVGDWELVDVPASMRAEIPAGFQDLFLKCAYRRVSFDMADRDGTESPFADGLITFSVEAVPTFGLASDKRTDTTYVLINNYGGTRTARTYYVDNTKADDTGDGLTTGNAKKTLKGALIAVNQAGEDDYVYTIKLLNDAICTWEEDVGLSADGICNVTVTPNDGVAMADAEVQIRRINIRQNYIKFKGCQIYVDYNNECGLGVAGLHGYQDCRIYGRGYHPDTLGMYLSAAVWDGTAKTLTQVGKFDTAEAGATILLRLAQDGAPASDTLVTIDAVSSDDTVTLTTDLGASNIEGITSSPWSSWVNDNNFQMRGCLIEEMPYQQAFEGPSGATRDLVCKKIHSDLYKSNRATSCTYSESLEKTTYSDYHGDYFQYGAEGTHRDLNLAFHHGVAVVDADVQLIFMRNSSEHMAWTNLLLVQKTDDSRLSQWGDTGNTRAAVNNYLANITMIAQGFSVRSPTACRGVYFQNVIAQTIGVLAGDGVVIESCRGISSLTGSEYWRGTCSTGDPAFLDGSITGYDADAIDYQPTASSPALTLAAGSTLFMPYDLYGNEIATDGSGYVGALQEEPAGADTTPPTFDSAATDAAGAFVYVHLIEVGSPPVVPADDPGGFTVTVEGAPRAIVSSDRSLDGLGYDLELESTVYTGETVTVSYDAGTGGVGDSAVPNNTMESWGPQAVTNLSEVPVPDTTPPVWSQGEVSTDGGTVTVTLEELGSPPVLPAEGASGFSLTVAGAPRAITAVTQTLDGLGYDLTAESTIYAGQAVVIAYDADTGNVTDSALVPNTMEDFEESAANNSEADITPPTFVSATLAANGTTLTIALLEADSPPVLPATGVLGFTVHVNGNPVANTGTAAETTVTLELISQVRITDSVAVWYDVGDGNVTDSATPPNAMAPFEFQAVTNNSEYCTSPGVTTGGTSLITRDGATVAGQIVDEGGGNISAFGVCYAETEDPDLTDTCTTEVTKDEFGNFESTITGLDPDTTYYVRAYATNEAGTGYGESPGFTTLETIYYVAADGDDDTCEATLASPCGTLQKVVEDFLVETGTSTVYVQSGDYGDSTGTSVTTKTSISLNPVANTATLLIEGYATTPGDGHSADLGTGKPTIATSSTAWCVLRSTAGNYDTGATTIRNISFAPTAQTGDFPSVSWGTEAGNAPDADLTLEYCDFDPFTTTRGIVRTWTTAGGSSTRDMTIRGCTWTPNGLMNGAMFAFNEVGDITIDDCTLGTNSEANAYFLQMLTSATSLTVTDTTGTFGNSGIVATWTGAGALTGLTAINFTGNTLTTGGTYFLQLGTVTLTPTVRFHNNTLAFKGDFTIGPGDDATPPNDYGYVSVVGNTITGTTVGASDHGLAVMCGVVRGEVGYNKVLGDTNFEWAMVVKGSNLDVHHNTSVGKFAMLCTEGNNNFLHHNTLYCNQSGGYALILNRNVGNATADYPNYTTITDNILHKGSGVYAFYMEHYTTGDTDPAAYVATRVDRNLYYAPANNLCYINGAAVANLAALPAAWAAYTGADTTNDANSLSGDPLFYNTTTGDYRIKLTSPARGTQYATPVLRLWNDKGAWQRRAFSSFGPYRVNAEGTRVGPWPITWDEVGPYGSQ